MVRYLPVRQYLDRVPFSVYRIRIRDIKHLLIRTKAKPIRHPHPISHHPHISTRGIKPIHLIRELRLRPEVLLPPIRRVGKPDTPVLLAHHDVVHRVEFPAVEIRDEGERGRGARHVVEAAGGGLLGALRAEEDTGFVVGAAVGHEDVGGRA